MSRDEAIEILRYLPINIGRQNGKHLIQEAMDMAIEALEQPTADVVEVVRCKDCKYGEIDDEDLYLCRYHGSSWNEGNHFCSYGERREDDKE